VLSDRVDGLTRQIDDLESKAQSLQTTIDRLNVALAHSAREESSHKDKVSLQILREVHTDGSKYYFKVFERFTLGGFFTLPGANSTEQI
jgi:hypothetical protein